MWGTVRLQTSTPVFWQNTSSRSLILNSHKSWTRVLLVSQEKNSFSISFLSLFHCYSLQSILFNPLCSLSIVGKMEWTYLSACFITWEHRDIQFSSKAEIWKIICTFSHTVQLNCDTSTFKSLFRLNLVRFKEELSIYMMIKSEFSKLVTN